MKTMNKVAINYFLGCKSQDELKAKYRELAKQLHPDMPTGSEITFKAMKAELDYIVETNQPFPISSNHQAPNYVHVTYTSNSTDFKFDVEEFFTTFNRTAYEHSKPKESTINYEKVTNDRATNFFNTLRDSDKTFDVIDIILTKAKKEGLKKLWVYQEVQKLYQLDLNHFKYVTWKLGDSISIANTLFSKYMLNKTL